ncbi:MAG: hypothetical protein K9I95_09530 [Flavobacteriaceae bacterium]|nr:hypothetical protein [Flavobacteriaceae bacterium]
MKNQIKTIIIVLALIISSSAFAGRNSDNRRSDDRRSDDRRSDDNSDDNSEGNNDSVPLDGGLSILLLGAAAFGVKKLRDNKNGTI